MDIFFTMTFVCETFEVVFPLQQSLRVTVGLVGSMTSELFSAWHAHFCVPVHETHVPTAFKTHVVGLFALA